MFEALTLFDIGVITIVGLSAIFAFSRGFVTVALSFAAWGGAFLATVFAAPFIQPYARELVEPRELADFLALLMTFFGALVLLKIVAHWIGKIVKESPVGFLDRSLGFLFGLARGAVFVAVAFLLYSKIQPEDGPEWVEKAKLKPLVAWSAEMVEGFAADMLGKDPKEKGAAYIEKVKASVPSQFLLDELEKEAPKYTEEAKKELDRLLNDVAKDTDAEKQKDGDTR